MWDLWTYREPVGVIDMFETQFGEHLLGFVVGIDDASCDVDVLLGQSLGHYFGNQRAQAASLISFVDLQ